MDPDAVAKAFVQLYYSTFDSNRAALVNLYQDSSMLTFEGQKFQGAQSIVQKLKSLQFQQCLHHVSTTDCQPSGAGAGMLVFVSGSIQIAGEAHLLKFSQIVTCVIGDKSAIFNALNEEEILHFHSGLPHQRTTQFLR